MTAHSTNLILLTQFHYYPIGHAEADGYLSITYLDGYWPSHKHRSDLGYSLTRSNAQGTEAVNHSTSAQDFNHYAALSRWQLCQGYRFAFWSKSTPESKSESAHKSVHR